MDCYLHPGAASVGTCVACVKPLCSQCREDVASHAMCRPCIAATTVRLTAEPPSIVVEPSASSADPPVGSAIPLPYAVSSQPAESEPVATEQASTVAGEFAHPGIVRRIARGMLWGVLYGQWWTAWTIASECLWGHASVDLKFILFAVVLLVVYGFAGSLTGLIIGASNASLGTGVAIGIGAGLLLCGLEVLLSHDPGSLINIVFYFFTGRFVGAGITWRVQQPVGRKARVASG